MEEDNNDEIVISYEGQSVRKVSVIEYTINVYEKGFIDALREFAYWKDGQQFVGTNDVTLKEAIETIKDSNYYSPPHIKL